MKKLLLLSLIVLGTYNTTHAQYRVFDSGQVGTSPVNNYYLKTDGKNSFWAAVTGSGGSGGASAFSTSTAWGSILNIFPNNITDLFSVGYSGSGVATSSNAEFFVDPTAKLGLFLNSTKVGIGTTSPYAPLSVVGQIVGQYFTATSTTSTSTFSGGLNVSGAINSNYIKHTHQTYAVGDSLTNSIYTNKLQTLLGSSWNVINRGLGGDITSRMLRRFNTDVVNSGDAEYVIILGGVNDTIQVGDDATQIETNLQAMYTAAHNANIKVVAVKMTPWKSNAYWTAGHQTVTDAVNTWISTTATNVDYIIDAYTALEDPVTPDTLLAAYDSGDGLHLSTAGYELLATTIYNGTTFTTNNTYNSGTLNLSGPNVSLNQNLRRTDVPTFAGLIVDTNTLYIPGTYPYNVGIGSTSPGQKLSVAGDILGNNFIGAYFTSTTTTATSTFVGGTVMTTASTTALLFPLGIINSSGHIGLGTTTPYSGFNFHSEGDIGVNGRIYVKTGGAIQGLTNFPGSVAKLLLQDLGGVVGIGTTTPWAQLSVNPNGISGPSFVVGSSTATNFIVTNGGNVGIGTTSPASKLSVSGDGYFTGGLGVGITNTTVGTLRVIDDTLIGQASTTGWSNLGVAGRYTATTYGAASNTDQGIAIVNTGNGVTNAPIGITFGTEFGAAGVWGFGGIYGLLTGGGGNTVGDVVIANRNVGTDTNFTPNLIVKFGGNVGIGTTSPLAKLYVVSTSTNTQPAFLIASTTNGIYANNSTMLTVLSGSGYLGLATTTPWRTLSVSGLSDLGINALAGTFTATSTTATSTFAGDVVIGVSGASGTTTLQFGDFNRRPCFNFPQGNGTATSSMYIIGTTPIYESTPCK